MKKGNTEEQIIGVLKQVEAWPDSQGTGAGTRRQRGDDLHVEEQVRRDEVNEARRLKGLEDENRPLKHMVADLSLDKEALSCNAKTARAVGRRRDVALVMSEFHYTERKPASSWRWIEAVTDIGRGRTTTWSCVAN